MLIISNSYFWQVILNGHPTVIRESIKWVDLVEQMRRHWNYSDSGYPYLIALYAKLVRYLQRLLYTVERLLNA